MAGSIKGVSLLLSISRLFILTLRLVTGNYRRPQPASKAIVHWPESQWRYLAKGKSGLAKRLTYDDLISDKPILAPDFDWRWYSVLWEWAMSIE